MDKARIVVEDVLTSLEMRDSVRQVYTEETDSPWNEKVLMKRKKDYLDVKISVWNDNLYLYGRIYRLLLYIRDILDPAFEYDSKKAPKESESGARELYSQIWSTYIDSRLERARIPNFYDLLLRKNMMTEALKEFEWEQSRVFFDALWDKESLTHAQIVRYAYDPAIVSARYSADTEPLEIRIGSFLKEHSVTKHLQRLTSGPLRRMAEEILSFTVYHCRDVLITSFYFGIRFVYKEMTFAEMVIEDERRFLLTLHSPRSLQSSTVTVTESTDLQAVQNTIREVFFSHFLDQQTV